ncbi:3-phosphoshikimate 1-carboxyvinyltransferase [Enterococcus sp. AZ103]|uniref:3-phosphoshikimate 1-carboxyvinyltransferase n=1 Tax=Enterococcus sp. AZ103 TaxID=2774628 RepID=UPI003F29A134
MKLLQADRLIGELMVPPDKSISHRSIMFGAISQGTTTVHNFLTAEDCLSTIDVFKALGVDIQRKGNVVTVIGSGIDGLEQPQQELNAGNSGTTLRLSLGILAACGFTSKIAGDHSLNKRPMERVMSPLRQMGANINGENQTGLPPITITGGKLKPIEYIMPVASAQVKSAILFAALQTDGETTIIEKEKSRNHTEEMIEQFGGTIKVQDKKIKITGKQKLIGQEITVPGDISSAAFFIVAGLILNNSQITLKQVGINPTRTGIIDVLKQMGGAITFSQVDKKNQAADLKVSSSKLKAVQVKGEIIPRLIDELPIIALAATQAEGTTVISDAAELKVKETNRIDVTASELNKLGANIETTEDGLIVHGPTKLHGGKVSSHGDHRIGMMLQIAALLTEEVVELENPEAINISYPTFFDDLAELKEEEQ